MLWSSAWGCRNRDRTHRGGLGMSVLFKTKASSSRKISMRVSGRRPAYRQMWKNDLVPTPCVILHGDNHSHHFANATNRAGNNDCRRTIGKRVRFNRTFDVMDFCKNRTATDEAQALTTESLRRQDCRLKSKLQLRGNPAVRLSRLTTKTLTLLEEKREGRRRSFAVGRRLLTRTRPEKSRPILYRMRQATRAHRLTANAPLPQAQ